MSKTYKITLSGLAIAIYIVLMYITQSFSFGQFQVRLATGLYSLSYQYSFLCIPLGIANMVSNILFGGDLVNGIFGFFAGSLTCWIICLLKKITKNKFILVLPIAIIPSLIIPIWLSFSLKISYFILVLSLFVGQLISAYTMGLLILFLTERINRRKDK